MRGLHILLQTAIPHRVPVYTTSGSELLHGDLHELAEAGVLLQLLGDLDAFVFILTEGDPEAIHVYKETIMQQCELLGLNVVFI